jgi:hypothetical protein
VRNNLSATVEGQRLTTCRNDPAWRRWGPYLSERQWGTVREDYSANGDAWNYFSHDHARSRAYRWGEDGLAGFAEEKLSWCLSLALWNERDPILKERLFGLTNGEGNHGEDVKELYYYLDGLPTHAYMRIPRLHFRTRVSLRRIGIGSCKILSLSSSTLAYSLRTAISTFSSNTPKQSLTTY